ncbi:MAG: hypothetical protein M3Z96_06175 [Pseudomonadota bacterium]|nr:hypothetical protein [Pseudomonadota bacterium]
MKLIIIVLCAAASLWSLSAKADRLRCGQSQEGQYVQCRTPKQIKMCRKQCADYPAADGHCFCVDADVWSWNKLHRGAQ